LSSDDELYSGAADQDGDAQSELARLNALHDDLVEAVQTAINPTVRADLAAELRSVRERIAELSMGEGGLRRAPEPGATVHSYEVPPAPAESNGAGFAGGGPPRYEEEPYTNTGGVPDAGPGFERAPSYGYQEPAYGQQPYAAGPPSDPLWNRQPPGFGEARPQTSFNIRAEPKRSFWSRRPWLPLVLAILGGLVLAAIVGFGGLLGDDDGSQQEAGADGDDIDPEAPEATAAAVANIRSMLDGMGFGSVVVEERDGAVALIGSVASDADRQAVIGAASALAGGLPFDSSGLTVAAGGATGDTPVTVDPSSPAAAMQRELDRILAVTPITFGEGQVAVTERHQLVLNNVVTTLQAYAGETVTIVGYTDDQGSPEANEQLSAARAQNVKDYLVGQGIQGDRLEIRAVGEAEATGVEGLAVLERRVEFEVVGAAVPGTGDGLRVAVVAPSASTDLAFTQSMVDAVNLLAGERNLQVSITDSTFVEADAEVALRGYADQGYDLVIAHGSQFGGLVQSLAPQFPNVTFAWGTASDTFGLPNVYAYDAKAQEGGYVLGAMASRLTSSGTVGVVGPFEVGDAALYINGFQAGATGEGPGTNVLVDYIESFSDVGLASAAATDQIGAGADVMTGSAQMVVGAVDVAAAQGVPWFGTQANQTSLAPNLVVASQVYRWEVILRPILDDISSGRQAGASSSLTLANGGLAIEFNDGYSLDPEVRQRAEQLAAEISSGAIVPPGG
jgi:basic membrane protein A